MFAAAQELSWIGEALMNRDELFASIVAARPGREETVYLERRGDSYSWRIMPLDAVVTETPSTSPDDPARTRAFFDDLLAELESMADRADRCRWPLDDPWPHSH